MPPMTPGPSRRRTPSLRRTRAWSPPTTGRAFDSCSDHSPDLNGAASLRRSHELKHVAVRVLEVKASTAVPIIELAVIEAPWCAAVGQTGLLDAGEDVVGVGVAHVERIVMTLERVVLVEQECQRIIDTHRREMPCLIFDLKAEDSG